MTDQESPKKDTKILVVDDTRINEQKTYSDIISKHVAEEIKEYGLPIGTPPKETLIPEVGKKFFIERNEYEVIYINIGRRRFTCFPSSGSVLPELNKTFMFEEKEFFVSYLDTKKNKFSCEPYEGEKNEMESKQSNP